MKILAVLTGGTIGSTQWPAGVDIDPAKASKLFARFMEDYPGKVDFTVIQPLYALSETRVPNDWTRLTHAILAAEPEQYDGVIVTHGTDTLSYTAAALSYTLCHLGVPVVLTAASHPLDDRRSNGYRNFCNAIWFMKDATAPKRGVYVIFENAATHRALVHLGTRIQEATAFNDDFDSVANQPFGEMVDGHFTRFDSPLNPLKIDLDEPQPTPLPEGDARFSDEILFMQPYPGLNYGLYDFTQKKPKAIAHRLFHSGTACVRKEPKSPYCLLQFAEKCLAEGIDIYACPTRERAQGERYVTANALLEGGLIPMENMGWEACITKLMLAYGSFTDPDARRAFLATTLAHEVVDLQRSHYGKHRRGR